MNHILLNLSEILSSRPDPVTNLKVFVNYQNFLSVIVLSIVLVIYSTSTIAAKNQTTLHGIHLGTFPTIEEAKQTATKLRQLKFETRIISGKNGYKVAAGAFSSQANLERALRRLTIAGLADKTQVINIPGKRSKKTVQKKIHLNRTTLTHPTSSPTMKDYVPKKEYQKLEQEVEILKAQMQKLLKQNPSAETQVAQAAPETENEPKVKKDAGGIAEGDREEEEADMQRQLDTFLRRQKVLFKKGEMEVEFDLSYAQDTTRTACFNPQPGSVFCPDKNKQVSPKLTSRSVDSSVSISYGIIDDLALSLSIPFSYNQQEGNFAPFVPEEGKNQVKHDNFIGLGDISGSLRYTAFHETGSYPGITVNLNAKAPTGKEEKRLGSGFWNIGASMSLTKTIDPVVFFGSIGYTSTLPARGVDLGDQISYSLGGGFSLNNRVSVAVALSGTTMLRNEINGKEMPGSAQNISSLQFSSTIKFTKALFVEPFVAFGLTDEANDFIFGINVPYRFEDKHPLPFF